MNLKFVEKVVNVGVNCSTKNGDNLINKEGLMAIIKDSCENNGLDNVLSILTNGITEVNVDYDILKKYLEQHFTITKNHNIKDEITINYVRNSISGRTEYLRCRYYNEARTDYSTRKRDNYTIEDWYDDYDNFNISIDNYLNFAAKVQFTSPVEECE